MSADGAPGRKAAPEPKGEERAEQHRLSPREQEVLRLVAEGRRSKEIAAILGISVRTAEAHRANIMLKLGLHSTAELVRYAVRNGVVGA